MLQLRGSLIPAALKSSIFAAIAAWVLKWAENQEYIALHDGIVKDASVYSGFSFTLAFMLVFRTSQSYNRFWHAATQVNAMRSQWYEAASSLCKFVEMSNANAEEIVVFKHTVVRLFSMLGATAMSALAVMEDENFSVVDIKGFSRADLDFLMQREDANHRPNVVYQWIQSLIVKKMHSGLLNVPAPILTRVFQEMERGMVEYGHVLQIMTIPFPFPYTQICWILIRIYMIFTPFMMCRWTDNEWAAALFTLASVLCIKTINMIATEIENPLGDDVNDLPVHQYHDEFNDHLVLLLQAGTLKPPTLQKTAVMDPDVLLDPQHAKGISLEQYYSGTGPEAVVPEAKWQGPEAVSQPSSEGGAPDWQAQRMRMSLSGSSAVEKLEETINEERGGAFATSSNQTKQPANLAGGDTRLTNAPDFAQSPQWREMLEELSQKLLQSNSELNKLLERQIIAIDRLVSGVSQAATSVQTFCAASASSAGNLPSAALAMGSDMRALPGRPLNGCVFTPITGRCSS
jgi:predicted membrane chloride channel (bestrophin family)